MGNSSVYQLSLRQYLQLLPHLAGRRRSITRKHQLLSLPFGIYHWWVVLVAGGCAWRLLGQRPLRQTE